MREYEAIRAVGELTVRANAGSLARMARIYRLMRQRQREAAANNSDAQSVDEGKASINSDHKDARAERNR